MVLQKKQTHKTKSAESILLQQNHRSKNIIICLKITKQISFSEIRVQMEKVI
jgi:hypothetical protein